MGVNFYTAAFEYAFGEGGQQLGRGLDHLQLVPFVCISTGGVEGSSCIANCTLISYFEEVITHNLFMSEKNTCL